ncbi:MAG: BlaI/MecI/CopY family transcriptional regulator, partial [Rudaea sp.]
RAVHEKLYGNDGAGYTAALKLLQIMHAKGLVQRDDSQRAHLYRAAIDQQHAQSRYLSDMVQRLFNGSTLQLVLQALGDHPETSREDLEEIRARLLEIETKIG